MTSESVRGHHEENFEWSQRQPLSKDERARAFLKFLDFSARNPKMKIKFWIFGVHHDENFEWSQAEPLRKDECARAYFRFLDYLLTARKDEIKFEVPSIWVAL